MSEQKRERPLSLYEKLVKNFIQEYEESIIGFGFSLNKKEMALLAETKNITEILKIFYDHKKANSNKEFGSEAQTLITELLSYYAFSNDSIENFTAVIDKILLPYQAGKKFSEDNRDGQFIFDLLVIRASGLKDDEKAAFIKLTEKVASRFDKEKEQQLLSLAKQVRNKEPIHLLPVNLADFQDLEQFQNFIDNMVVRAKEPINKDVLFWQLQIKAKQVSDSRVGFFDGDLAISPEAKTFLHFLSSLTHIMQPEQLTTLENEVLVAQTKHLALPSSSDDFPNWVQNSVGVITNFCETLGNPSLRSTVIDTAASMIVNQENFNIGFFAKLANNPKPNGQLAKELLENMVKKYSENLLKQTNFAQLLSNVEKFHIYLASEDGKKFHSKDFIKNIELPLFEQLFAIAETTENYLACVKIFSAAEIATPQFFKELLNRLNSPEAYQNLATEVIQKLNSEEILNFLQNTLPQSIKTFPANEQTNLIRTIERNLDAKNENNEEITKFLDEQRKTIGLNQQALANFEKLQNSFSKLSQRAEGQKILAKNYLATAKETISWINNNKESLKNFPELNEQAESISKSYQAMEQFVAEITAYQDKLSHFAEKEIEPARLLLENPEKTSAEKTSAMAKLSEVYKSLLSFPKPDHTTFTEKATNRISEFKKQVLNLSEQTSQMANQIQTILDRTQIAIGNAKFDQVNFEEKKLKLAENIETNKKEYDQIFNEQPKKILARAEKSEQDKLKLETLISNQDTLKTSVKTDAESLLSDEGSLAKLIKDNLEQLGEENRDISKKLASRKAFFNITSELEKRNSRLLNMPFIKKFHEKCKAYNKKIKDNEKKISTLKELNNERIESKDNLTDNSLMGLIQSLIFANENKLDTTISDLTTLDQRRKELNTIQYEIQELKEVQQNFEKEDLSEQEKLAELKSSIEKSTTKLQESTESISKIENKLQELQKAEGQLTQLQQTLPKYSFTQQAESANQKKATGNNLNQGSEDFSSTVTSTHNFFKPEPSPSRTHFRKVRLKEATILDPDPDPSLNNEINSTESSSRRMGPTSPR